LHILVGNVLPKNRKKTIAFFRSVKMIIHFSLPLGGDFIFLDFIDEKERSGILNLLVLINKIQKQRKGLYGLLNLEDTEREYKKSSDPFTSFILQIFDRDPESELPREQVLEYISILAENANIVLPETISTTYLTRLLHSLFNATTKRTTKSDEKGTEHRTYYKGIKFRYDFNQIVNGKIPSDFIPDEQNLDMGKLDKFEEFQNALQDYLSTVPNDMIIQLSNFFSLLNLYRWDSRLMGGNNGVNMDNWINVFEMLLNADSGIYPLLHSKFGHNVNKVTIEELKLFLEKELKIIQYFKTQEYHNKKFFEDLGVQLIDLFEFEGKHYYSLRIPEDLTGEEALKFSSYFSIKATLLSPEEYEECKKKKANEESSKINNVFVRILEDLGEVADVDTDYILRKEDIVSVSPGLADILISQGKAERMEVGK
ncbi:MAG: hypothetical protein ACP5L4_06500, partial [Thermoplasmata archaeon]